ncbi:hypothetical protein DFJ77DRAFT_503229 [Powellomyces hirtus]|nr:hypothetical protein DFJ77DRAFT_503229 [Powellomyces hirtus]
MRILVVTEYLPPYVSGIANRFKNLTKGYRDAGHVVTIASVAGTACDMVVPSLPNPFYMQQRMFIFPPWLLIWQLINPFTPVPYDIVHIVSPLCLAFVPLIPLFKLRGVKVYVSYHVLMEYYKEAYFYHKTIFHRLTGDLINIIYIYLYFIFLVSWADVVGVPSKIADSVVYKYAPRIHFMKSGLNTDVFVPQVREKGSMDDLLMASSSEVHVGNKEGGKRRGRGHVASEEEQLPPYSKQPSTEIVEPVEKGPTLVYVGRLAPEKNVQFLVKAMAHPSLSRATLVLVGDGPFRSHLECVAVETVGASHVYSKPTVQPSPTPYSSLAESPAMSATTTHHRVIFTGVVLSEQEVAKYYARADMFVSASASETFGFTVAEAMACGTPAVVVREGAFKSVYSVIDEWMFRDGDQEDFVQKIGTCFGDERARHLARHLALKHFRVSLAVDDLLQTYNDVVRPKQRVVVES